MRVARTAALAVGLASITFAFAARAAPQPVDYYGGPVVTNAAVIEVSWGSGVDSALTSALPAFYTQILQSPYMDWLGEYDTVGKTGKIDGQPGSNQRIFPGSFGGAFTISPSNTATTVTVTDIATEIAAQVQNKNLPAPGLDATGNVNTVYAIDFPKTITVKDLQGNASCSSFCAAYWNAQIGGKTVPLMLLPDTGAGSACAGGCGTGTDLQNATQWHSFLLLDVVTDPQFPTAANFVRPAAWTSSQGSPGDDCFTSSTNKGVVAGYTVAAGWSNRLSKCIVSDPSLPLCTGSNRPCRACAASDCSGATPACETTPANAHQTECVACAADSDCKAPTPTCDRTTDTCVAASPVDAGADASTTTDAGGAPDATTTDGGTNNGGGGGCSCTAASRTSPPGLLFAVGLAAVLVGRRRPRFTCAR